MEVIDSRGRLGAAEVEWLAERALAAAAWLGAGGEVRVGVVGDAEMSAAHERHSGVSGTTDVLTFDFTAGAGARDGELDVDILVCADEAARQAAGRGLSVERELLLYVVHGVLHCLGYGDDDEERARAMHRREDEVLSAIGVGVTYASGVDRGTSC